MERCYDLIEISASETIRNVFEDIEKYGFSRQKPFIIGAVEERMRLLFLPTGMQNL